MRIQYFYLTILIAGVLLVKTLVARYLPRSEVEFPHLLSSKDLDAEGLLAMGDKLPLSQAGIYELELVSGVSDSLANDIFVKKEEILRKSRAYPLNSRYKALELAKGVGAKSVEKLKLYIALE